MGINGDRCRDHWQGADCHDKINGSRGAGALFQLGNSTDLLRETCQTNPSGSSDTRQAAFTVAPVAGVSFV